ncbi:hypothetical protein AB1484_18735 [Parafrankia sp. FMc6]|uniref:hypothetical protein n=1 Tax=Parafrankia soli TaxID=2599596 RepID=UPI0034D75710
MRRRPKEFDEPPSWPDWIEEDAEWVPAGSPSPPPNPGRPRSELADVMVAPGDPPDVDDVYESVDGTQRYGLPGYALAFDQVGGGSEPRVETVVRDGVRNLVVGLVKTPSPAGDGLAELPHALSVVFQYRLPGVGGVTAVKTLEFPEISPDTTGTVVTAILPLTSPGMHQQVVAALGSLDSACSVVVNRSVTVACTLAPVPGQPQHYEIRTVSFTLPLEPQPLVLGPAQLARLAGGGPGPGPGRLVRHRVTTSGRSDPYWQDPADPALFYYLPDRFDLGRAPAGNRRPLLWVRTVGEKPGAELVSLAFEASAVVDPRRLEAARPGLAGFAAERGAAGEVRLEMLAEAQPELLLALPEQGAPASALTSRPAADIDLEVAVRHAETLTRENFALVREAFESGSTPLLRGVVRVGAHSDSPEDVPLELRLDRTAGDVVAPRTTGFTAERVTAVLANPCESPVRVDAVAAVFQERAADGATTPVPASVTGSAGDAVATVLPAGGEKTVTLTPARQLGTAGGEPEVSWAISATVEPDPAAVWKVVFDRQASVAPERAITVRAFPAMFAAPEGAADDVVGFVVTIDGASVTVDEASPSAELVVSVPVDLWLTDQPPPPSRYLTQTIWRSGAVGEAWADVRGTVVIPVKAAPPTGPPAPSPPPTG